MNRDFPPNLCKYKIISSGLFRLNAQMILRGLGESATAFDSSGLDVSVRRSHPGANTGRWPSVFQKVGLARTIVSQRAAAGSL